ncbi:MAG: glycine cleavage system aminomethyltransferase GcvT [Chloroflexi bacterium]|nr:glycine cleavage system aminomethyltransferase GcvT [Chloroflexota bacterium]
MELKRTPLYDTHRALGAKMVEFSGWEMPVQYKGILDEHRAVRNAAGLFDIDHMGQVRVTGRDARAYLQNLLTANFADMEINTAKYAVMCYADGTCVDDTFVYRFADEWMVVVNAGNGAKDNAWMLAQAHAQTSRFDVSLQDVSAEFYMLAFQGPLAEQVLQQTKGLQESFDLADLKYHHAREFHIHDERGIIARTGYTGEDGFELFIPFSHGKHVWDAILDAGKDVGVQPIGLGARDSLRFEAKFALYGHEIDANTTPMEAALGWACDLDKNFIGRDVLLKQKLEGVKKKLVGFEMLERGIARNGYEIASNGKTVGYVTSGMPAPTLEKNIGLGYVPPELAKIGTGFDILIRGKATKARVVKTPFYANRARGK